MVDIKGGQKAVLEAPGNLKKAAGMPGRELKGAADKALSPMLQKKREIEAAKAKAEAPVKLLQQKQQLMKQSADAAQKKADAAQAPLSQTDGRAEEQKRERSGDLRPEGAGRQGEEQRPGPDEGREG
jgi:cell division septum initiation protein DivIVA